MILNPWTAVSAVAKTDVLHWINFFYKHETANSILKLTTIPTTYRSELHAIY